MIDTIVAQPSDLELFTMFQVDVGELVINSKLRRGEEVTKEDKALIGTDLWYFTQRQRTGKVVDFDTDSPEEFKRMQKQEQAERAELLAALASDDMVMDYLEKFDISLTELLPPPKHV